MRSPYLKKKKHIPKKRMFPHEISKYIMGEFIKTGDSLVEWYQECFPHSLREIKELDRLELEKPLWQVAKDKEEYLHAHTNDIEEILIQETPFLYKGVIKYPVGENVISYLYWEMVDENCFSYCYVNSIKDDKGVMVVPYDVVDFGTVEWYIEDGAIRLAGTSNSPAEIALEHMPKNTPPEVIDYAKRQSQYATTVINENYFVCVMNIFRYVNIVVAEYNEEDSPKGESKGEKKDTLKIIRGSKKKNRPRKIVLKEIIIRQGKDSNIKISSGKIQKRHTEAWRVRGHIRRYKSGKTIWISPYEKGPKRNQGEIQGKTYVIP